MRTEALGGGGAATFILENPRRRGSPGRVGADGGEGPGGCHCMGNLGGWGQNIAPLSGAESLGRAFQTQGFRCDT